MKHKREKSVKMTYYGILGIDPISQNPEDLEFDMAKEE